MCIVAIFCGERAAASLFMYFRAPAYYSDIRVMLLPNVSQMYPCLLLAGTHVTFGGSPFIRQQYRHAMSNRVDNANISARVEGQRKDIKYVASAHLTALYTVKVR